MRKYAFRIQKLCLNRKALTNVLLLAVIAIIREENPLARLNVCIQTGVLQVK